MILLVVAVVFDVADIDVVDVVVGGPFYSLCSERINGYNGEWGLFRVSVWFCVYKHFTLLPVCRVSVGVCL
jgi:hypothetical protein